MIGALWLALAHGGCATQPGVAQSSSADAAPLLRLSPASLGRTLALQQQITVHAHGQTQVLQVLLEADAQAVRVALLNLGQTAARLEWDGQSLTQTRAPWWPNAIRSERILSDLQFVWWPVDAVRQTLPPGWTLTDEADQRVLQQQGQSVLVIRYRTATHVELHQLREGYQLDIESQASEGAP